MNEPNDSIEARVDRLQSEIGALRARIGALETQRAVPAPPPVAFEVPFRMEPPPGPPPAPPPPPRAPAAPGEDTEFVLGSKVLPIVGAIVLLIGIGSFVSYAIQQNWITPTMQMLGAAGLCLLFVVVGFFKLDEREQFGKILVGIGSCGLYLTAGAGYGVHKLYTGETTVLLFMLLSLANLAFSFWKASKAFLSIGLIGGLAGALMPLERGGAEAAAALYALILVPSCLVAARHRWSGAILGLWVVSGMALLPILVTRSPWELRVAMIYFHAAACSMAYLLADRDRAFDPQAAFPPAAVMIAALAAMGVHGGTEGTLHVALFGVLAGLGSLLVRDRPAKQSLLVGAVAAVGLVGPLGYTAVQATLIYSALAFGIGLLGAELKSKPAAGLALAEACAALLAYFYAMVGRAPVSAVEAGLALACLAAVISAAFASRSAWEGSTAGFHIAAAVAWPLVTRLAIAAIRAQGFDLDEHAAITGAWVVYGAALLASGFGWSSRELRGWGLAVLGAAVVKVVLVDSAELDAIVRVPLLMGLGLALLGGGYVYIRIRNKLAKGGSA